MKQKIMNCAGFVFLITLFLMVPLALGAETASPEETGGILNGMNKSILGICAMASVGISCIMSAYALAKIGSAALGAMSEKPEIGGRAIVFLGMAEGIAIYGLIVAIMILAKI